MRSMRILDNACCSPPWRRSSTTCPDIALIRCACACVPCWRSTTVHRHQNCHGSTTSCCLAGSIASSFGSSPCISGVRSKAKLRAESEGDIDYIKSALDAAGEEHNLRHLPEWEVDTGHCVEVGCECDCADAGGCDEGGRGDCESEACSSKSDGADAEARKADREHTGQSIDGSEEQEQAVSSLCRSSRTARGPGANWPRGASMDLSFATNALLFGWRSSPSYMDVRPLEPGKDRTTTY